MTRVKTVRRRDNLLQGPSWGARCADCGEWLTKYDHTEEEARASAVGVSCRCPETRP